MDPTKMQVLQDNLPLTIVGFLIVFGVLLIISFTIFAIRQLDEKWRHTEKIQNAEMLDREPTVDQLTVVLLTAAAATVLRGRFRIRRIRRLMPSDSPRSPWSAQGRSELQGSHTIQRQRKRSK